MKEKILALSILAMFVAVGYGVLTEPPSGDPIPSASSTKQYKYEQMRSITSADTALDPNDKYWSSIKSTWFPIDWRWNRVELAFYAYGDGTGDGDPNAGDFDIKVYACRYLGGAKTVFEGYCKVGEEELTVDPATGSYFATTAAATLDPNESYKWADYCDANGVGDRWPSGTVLSGNDESDTTGDILTVTFDPLGCYGVWVEVDQMSGVSTLTVLATGY